jgi:hypothetical protein
MLADKVSNRQIVSQRLPVLTSITIVYNPRSWGVHAIKFEFVFLPWPAHLKPIAVTQTFTPSQRTAYQIGTAHVFPSHMVAIVYSRASLQDRDALCLKLEGPSEPFTSLRG